MEETNMSSKEETKLALADIDEEVNKIRRIKKQMKIYLEKHPQNDDANAMVNGMEIQYKQLLKAQMILNAHNEDLK